MFALYKREAARLEQFLQRNNYDAVAVHGDKGQVGIWPIMPVVVAGGGWMVDGDGSGWWWYSCWWW